jgi:hypothetical protein
LEPAARADHIGLGFMPRSRSEKRLAAELANPNPAAKEEAWCRTTAYVPQSRKGRIRFGMTYGLAFGMVNNADP